jgi:hypothetical protein
MHWFRHTADGSAGTELAREQSSGSEATGEFLDVPSLITLVTVDNAKDTAGKFSRLRKILFGIVNDPKLPGFRMAWEQYFLTALRPRTCFVRASPWPLRLNRELSIQDGIPPLRGFWTKAIKRISSVGVNDLTRERGLSPTRLESTCASRGSIEAIFAITR